jgi:pimeloyl-ACP methyl ester carboxylesterase
MRSGDLDVPLPIPELDFGGEGYHLAFLHANAYPPECYRLLLNELGRTFRVRAMLQRPLWKDSDPALIESWHVFGSDFLAWLRSTRLAPIVAVGHSLGAIAALRAAAHEPDSFRALILLDPVLATPGRILAWRLMRHLPFGHGLHSAVRGARKRRKVFRDLEEVFQVYRRHAVFRRFSDECLREAIRGLFEEANHEVWLRYSRTWEAQVYATAIWNDGDLWEALPVLRVPTLIIRGTESETLSDDACDAARAANSRIQVARLDRATHLVPLERPLEVSLQINEFAQSAGGLSQV